MPDWLIQALVALVAFLLGGFVGDLKGTWNVHSLRRDLSAHAALDGHPVSNQQRAEMRARLERIEQDMRRSLERIEEKLERIAQQRGS